MRYLSAQVISVASKIVFLQEIIIVENSQLTRYNLINIYYAFLFCNAILNANYC